VLGEATCNQQEIFTGGETIRQPEEIKSHRLRGSFLTKKFKSRKAKTLASGIGERGKKEL